jgi:nitrite reductase/ring-hydroxylating ferredoxin subunit
MAGLASEVHTKHIRPFIDQIGRTQGLDTVAAAVDKRIRPLLERNGLKDALNGKRLGHRLHPLLTDVAIGSLTAASIVDFLSPSSKSAARKLSAVGLAAAVPTALSGYADWMDVYGDGRRIGLVHAATNAVGLGLMFASFKRRCSKRGGGRFTALAGLGVISAGGYLGGHLTYVLGLGVDHAAFEPRIEDWVDVAALDSVTEHEAVKATAAGVELVLVRQGDEVTALSNHCSHAGWPLADGKVEGGFITCPYHGSRFCVKDGQVDHGPAASPQRTYEVRTVGGRIEVRSR